MVRLLHLPAQGRLMFETLPQLDFYGPRFGVLLLGYAAIMLGLLLLVLALRRQ